MHPCISQVVRYAFSFYAPKQRTRIAEGVCGAEPRCLPGDMLVSIRKRDGFGVMLLAELVLFGWCLIVCLLLDLLLDAAGPLWRIPGLFACMISFSLCRENRVRAVLKAIFIFYSFCFGGYWTWTWFFLAVFEHLAVGGDPGHEETDV